MKALLLCAGQGTRFKPQTLRYSKVVLPFLNIPILSYPLKILEDIGVQDITVNTHHFPQQIEKSLAQLNPHIKNTTFTHEPSLLGGAGTLKKNADFFKDDLIVYLNGDSVFLCQSFFSDLQKQHLSTNALITFLVTPAYPHYKIDLWADENGKISLQPSSKRKPYFFPGFALLHPKCLSLLKANDFNIFKSIVSKYPEQCFVHVKKIDFFEVGYLSAYLKSTQKCLENLFLKPASEFSQTLKKTLKRFQNDFDQFQGKNFYSKTSIHKKPEGLLMCGKDIEGLENIHVKNFAVIGDHCKIKKPLVMESSVLASQTQTNQDALFQTLQV